MVVARERLLGAGNWALLKSSWAALGKHDGWLRRWQRRGLHAAWAKHQWNSL